MSKIRRYFRTCILVLRSLSEPNLNQTNIRLTFILLCLMIGFLSISIRAYNIVLMRYEEDFSIAKLTSNTASFHRRDIIDRNGNVLGIDLAISSIYANPRKILDPKEAASKIHKIFPELNYKSLLNDLSSAKSFVWIKRNATPKEIYAINKLGIPGIQYENGHRRFYPFGSLLSHVVGYVGIDGMGLAGVEKYFDKKLIIDEKSDNTEPIKLSIDLRVQSIVHEELTAAFQEFHPIGAAAIVTDVTNGEILAMVSLPDFDPHNPGKAKPEQLFNRASLASQELGSVFKSITMAIALDSGIISMDDKYDVSEPIQYARFKLRDYRGGKGGIQSIPEIFINSSNIGMAKIARDVGIDNQKKYLRKFGLLEDIRIEIPEKGHAVYPSENKWGLLSTMTISYGHGIMLTPLHFIRSFAGIVNNGKMFDLTLVAGGNSSKEPKTIISKSTSEALRKLLRLVVETGTGKKANAEGYIVGGKTGSAEKITKGKYNKRANLSSFIGMFPANEPKYAVFVLLDEPKGNQSTFGFATGGWTAAPIVGNIVSRMGTLLGIKPLDEESPEVAKKLWINYKKHGIDNGIF